MHVYTSTPTQHTLDTTNLKHYTKVFVKTRAYESILKFEYHVSQFTYIGTTITIINIYFHVENVHLTVRSIRVLLRSETNNEEWKDFLFRSID